MGLGAKILIGSFATIGAAVVALALLIGLFYSAGGEITGIWEPAHHTQPVTQVPVVKPSEAPTPATPSVFVQKLDQVRMDEQQIYALQAIRTIHMAQTQYYSQYSRYGASLVELGPPPEGTPISINAADLIPGDLAARV